MSEEEVKELLSNIESDLWNLRYNRAYINNKQYHGLNRDLLDYIRKLEQERNNYKELYEKALKDLVKSDHTIIELKKWLKEMINEIKENDIYDRTEYECTQIATLESTLAKVEDLERL